VKLYVCYGAWTQKFFGHAHPCGEAHQALLDAGYDPEVVKVYGLGPLPLAVQPKRRQVKAVTGRTWVPAIEFDDGTGFDESAKIIEWAKQNPAAEAEASIA